MTKLQVTTRSFIAVVILCISGIAASSAHAVIVIGPPSSSSPATWLTDGFGDTGSINYTYATQGSLAFVSSGAQATTGAVQVEWPSPGLGPVDMGTAGGGTVQLTTTPGLGEVLTVTGIAPIDATYAILNPADLGNPGIVAANKLTVTAGTVMHWIDTDPTLNEQYSFVQVNNGTNQNNGGAIGAIGFQLALPAAPTPEPSTLALAALGFVGLAFGRRRRRK